MYNRSIQPSDIDNLSNSELLELSKNASKLHPDAGVVKLTSNTVAKPSQDMDEDEWATRKASIVDATTVTGLATHLRALSTECFLVLRHVVTVRCACSRLVRMH